MQWNNLDLPADRHIRMPVKLEQQHSEFINLLMNVNKKKHIGLKP